MQQHHDGAVQAKQDAVDVPVQPAADLEESKPKAIDERLADGPGPLHLPDVRANLPARRRRKRLEPIPHRLSAACRPVEPTFEDRLLLGSHTFSTCTKKGTRALVFCCSGRLAG